MKRFFTLTLIILLSVSLNTNSQNWHFLGYPQSHNYVTTQVGDIVFGQEPAGSENHTVIVFVHGKGGNPSHWLTGYYDEGNEMYRNAYNAGYRTAFVDLAGDKTMWENGSMLKNMLTEITDYYGVSKVVIVAHSKGGLDTDAAMIHYGAHTMVEKVITLGSPHHGSPLADLIYSSWTWWLAYIFGEQNDAAYVLQSGYMSYFRSVTDSHQNNANTDFYTIGAWGYSGMMRFSGWYLNATGGGKKDGGNDGLVTYPSSYRPNSMRLLRGYGDQATNYNHAEILLGQHMWNSFYSYIPLGTPRGRKAAKTESYNPNAIVTSNMQMVVSTDGNFKEFVIEEGAENVKIDIKQKSNTAKVNVINPNGFDNTRMFKNKRSVDGLGLNTNSFQANKIAAGTYKIKSSEPFVALITTEKGITAKFTSDLNNKKLVYSQGETMNFNIELLNAKDESVKSAKVTGTMMRTSDLKGKGVSDSPQVIEFELKDNKFVYTMNSMLSPGIYSVSVNVGGDNFRKSVITSIAVTSNNSVTEIEDKKTDFASLSNYPNPVKTETTFAISLKTSGNNKLTVYDMQGRSVKQFNLSNLCEGNHELKWDISSENLKNGMYVYELSNGSLKTSKIMVVNK